MNRSMVRGAAVEVLHAVFILVASIVLVGWVVRLRGGDPSALLDALPRGLGPGGLGAALDMAAVLLVAALGCLVARLADVWNVAAEGQVRLGAMVAVVLAGWGGGGSLGVVATSLVGAALVGGLLSLVVNGGTLEEEPGRDVKLGFLVSAALVTTTLPVVEGVWLFPVLSTPWGPRSGLLVALICFVAVAYALHDLRWGVVLRAAGTAGGGARSRTWPVFLAGALCGVAGALFVLDGPRLALVAPAGLGVGLLALAAVAAGGASAFWSLPLVCVGLGAIVAGWLPVARAGLGVASMAACALALAWFLGDAGAVAGRR